MALNFKGNIDAADLAALEHDDVQINDAYYIRTPGSGGSPDTFAYKYCTNRGVQANPDATPPVAAVSPTWTSYDPIQIVKDVVYSKVWACKGAPSATANAAQFPTLGLGCFAVDVSTGDFYGYDGSWQKWTGTAVISL